jgi:hypothetical protein
MRMEGKTQNFFIRHPSAFRGPAAHNFPSVGAFDLCPGRDGMQLPVLKKFLSGALESVAAGNPYREEEGLYE